LSRRLQELLSEPTAAKGLEGLHGTPPAEEVRGPSGRRYGGKSCGYLKPANWPRRWAIQIVEWKRFDAIILFVIACNCFTQAWASPLDPEGTAKQAFIHLCARDRPPSSRARRTGQRRLAFLTASWCDAGMRVVLPGCLHRRDAGEDLGERLRPQPGRLPQRLRGAR
jgi:hypothetical protein